MSQAFCQVLHMHYLICLILINTYRVSTITIPGLQMKIAKSGKGNYMHKNTHSQ